MSAQQTPDKHQTKSGSRRWREQTRSVTLAILAVLITLFAVFNLKQVKVDWIVGSARAPLIVVIVISLLVGIVLAYIAERRSSGKRR